MSLKTYSIRGATSIASDCKEEIISSSVELIKEIKLKNNLENDDVVNIFISTTKDIVSFYPAKAVRESNILSAPLFSCLEPDIDGSLKLCIRMMVTVNMSDIFTPKHIYLKNAVALRPDMKS